MRTVEHEIEGFYFPIKIRVHVDPEGRVMKVEDNGTDPLANVTENTPAWSKAYFPKFWHYMLQQGVLGDAHWKGKTLNDLYGYRMMRPDGHGETWTANERMFLSMGIDFTCGHIESSILAALRKL